MTRTIFQTVGTYTLAELEAEEVAIKEFLEENECEVSEEAINRELYFYEELNFNDERANLNKELGNNIILFGSLGRWNGRKSAYKVVGSNLKDIISGHGMDDFKIYQKGKKVLFEGHDHDGSSYMEYRLVRDNVNIDNFLNKIYNNEEITSSILNYYTRALGSEIDSIYGKQIVKK